MIAGNSLFHVVVDTDEIASKIIHYLTAEKGGRVSFLPLNRMGGHNKKMPESEAAVPLLDYLQYDPKYAPAFKQVRLSAYSQSGEVGRKLTFTRYDQHFFTLLPIREWERWLNLAPEHEPGQQLPARSAARYALHRPTKQTVCITRALHPYRYADPSPHPLAHTKERRVQLCTLTLTVR